MSEWINYGVSVDLGEPLGCYQGLVAEVQRDTITLKKVFRNGFPYATKTVTLKAEDIKDLKIHFTAKDCPKIYGVTYSVPEEIQKKEEEGKETTATTSKKINSKTENKKYSKKDSNNNAKYLFNLDCTKGCENACSCRKAGLKCSSVCRHCSGAS